MVKKENKSVVIATRLPESLVKKLKKNNINISATIREYLESLAKSL